MYIKAYHCEGLGKMTIDLMFGEVEEVKFNLLSRKQFLEKENKKIKKKIEKIEEKQQLSELYEQQYRIDVELLLCDRILCKFLEVK